jgi:hypothetical protein
MAVVKARETGDMTREAGLAEAAHGFRFHPAGPFLLRDYSNEDPDDLTVLRDLLEEIIAQHKLLIPGSMNRLMVQWHADLRRAIEAARPAPAPPALPAGEHSALSEQTLRRETLHER